MPFCNPVAMEDDRREEDPVTTVSVRNPSHHVSRPCKIKRSSDLIDGVDLISDLPDEILHHIFSFIPTELAIRTSVLSKRWRHVWSETPHLSFEWVSLNSINKTLVNYSASKITSFHLCNRLAFQAHHVNSLIEFAVTHNVKNLSLVFRNPFTRYDFPDFFYINSSVKQLLLNFQLALSPICIVSWTSLKSLSLRECNISDESFLKFLSHCPILESLRLDFCKPLTYLDLSQSLSLTSLEVEFCPFFGQPMKIMAPHIYYLKLRNSEAQCTLVDVSSLTEADVDITNFKTRTCNMLDPLKPDVLLAMVQTTLEKLKNVEKLTLGVNFLQILSLSKILSLPVPTLNVKTLTLETMIMRSVVPGIAMLLQNSPGLKKLSSYTIKKCSILLENYVNNYLDSQDLKSEQCWRLNVVFPNSWRYDYDHVVGPELMASFMEFLLANTRTLETLVVRLGSYITRSRFEELVQIAGTLSHKNKVSIVLK